MKHFTEAQLQELETVFKLKRVGELKISSGVVRPNNKVWWKGRTELKLVTAKIHWENIRHRPEHYSHEKPTIKEIIYMD